MTDFNITVRVDPSGAVRGTAKVAQSLDSLERKASQAEAAVQGAGRIDPRAASRGAASIQQSLQGVQGTAFQTGSILRDALNVTGEGTASAAADVQRNLSAAGADADAFGDKLQDAFNADSRRLENEVEDVRKELDKTKRSASGLQGTLGKLFAGFSAAIAIRETVQLADSFTNIQNRLRGVTDGTAELTAVTNELFNISQRTRGEFEATATTYAQVRRATTNLGLSQQETLNFSESLNQAVALSGASAETAAQSLRQLGQGLSSGALRGDEFVSVSEGIPEVAQVIATSLGVTRGELRELAAQGEITADKIITAFAEAREELQDRFGETIPTIGQGFTVLNNALTKAVGEFATASGASEGFARTLIFLGENINSIIRAAVTLGAILGAQLAARSIPLVIAALSKLRLAILTNPIGAIATAVSLGVAAFAAFGNQIRLSSDSAATALDVVAVAWGEVQAVLSSGIQFVTGLFSGFQVELDSLSLEDLIRNFGRGLDVITTVFVATFLTIKEVVTNILADLSGVVADVLNSVTGGVEDFLTGVNVIKARLSGREVTADDVVKLVDFESRLASTGRTAGEALGANIIAGAAQFTAGRDFAERVIGGAEARANDRAQGAGNGVDLNAGGGGGGRGGGGGAGGPDIDGARTASIEGTLDALRREEQLLQVVGIERDILQQQLSAEDALRTALSDKTLGLTEEQINSQSMLTAAEEQRIATLVRSNAAVEEQRNLENGRTALVNSTVQSLEEEARVLQLVGSERQAQQTILGIEAQLRDDLRQSSLNLTEQEIAAQGRLSEAERRRIGSLVAANQELAAQRDLLAELRDPQEQFNMRLSAAQSLFDRGQISAAQYTTVLRETAQAQREFRISTGEGSIADGFLAQLERMIGGVNNFRARAGTAFGSFFTQLGEGFSSTIGDAVFDIDNLGESLKAVARQAISSLIGALVQLGIQFVANAILGQALGATTAAATAVQMGAISTAAAPAAALVSLATSGANAIPAGAAITGTVGLAKVLSKAGAGFMDGGFIGGAGSSRSDSIPIAASKGEFMVNARAARANAGLLTAINNGEDVNSGGDNITMNFNFPSGTDVDGFRKSRTMIEREMRSSLSR